MTNSNESGKEPGTPSGVPMTTRREFFKNTGRIAATSALAAGLAPRIYAAGSGTIKVALVGCGGRGTGAASNALSVKNGPIKLVAMADVFQSRLDRSYKNLGKGHAKQLDAPKERQFLGFDGYKKAMDCLDKGDVVILATPPAFRWVHFTYAIAKGLNVFMEKPVTVDGPTTRKMLKLAEESVSKNLKVGVEPQSGCRPYDPPLQRPAGIETAYRRRRDRQYHRDARLPDGWARMYRRAETCRD